MATDNQSDVSPHLKPIHRVAGKEMAQRMSDSVAENLGQRCIARPAGLSEEFGHFHCRVAASEDRPAFQGRSRQPDPILRRGATDEMANLNGVRDSSAADAARLPDGGTKLPALKGRPTVKRRDAAAKLAFRAVGDRSLRSGGALGLRILVRLE